ncbi:Protein dispatched-like 1 [Symbiodinium microadriaticum]|uniref:Protein dispatched-like 1 n=1 Tax=Symbiodinium microadriaticum TaxID=2951 RepID=A0A1Q9E0J1_SYMMI|nr:Protein dispatched-like 1 [Symbiodinium microadriaticum]
MDAPPPRRRLGRHDAAEDTATEPRRRLRRRKDQSRSPERTEANSPDESLVPEEPSEPSETVEAVASVASIPNERAPQVPPLPLADFLPGESHSAGVGAGGGGSEAADAGTSQKETPLDATASPASGSQENQDGLRSFPAQWPGTTTEILAKPVQSQPLVKERPVERAAVKRPVCLSPCCASFPCCTAHCPITFCLLVFLGMFTTFGVFWRELAGINIVTDTSVFLEADSRSNAIRAAYLQAYNQREPSARRLGPRRLMTGYMPHIDTRDMYKMHNLALYYRTDSSAGLLDPGISRMVQAFELSIRDGAFYQQLCVERTTAGLEGSCDPGHSFINAVFPSMSDPNLTQVVEDLPHFDRRLDGRGVTAMDSKTVKNILVSKEVYRQLMLPMDYDVSQPLMAARSFFAFNILCCRIDDSAASRSKSLEEIAKVWNQFLSMELLPKLTDFNSRQNLVELNFEGGGLATLQLWNTLAADCLLAIGSVSFIVVYLTCHAGSPILSCGSILLTILAIPSAYLASALLSGSREITGVAFLSIFLITGLGADVVLVFVNFWEASKARFGSDTAARVKFLYRNAGLACLATTFTTAASFFANLASVLRALREFGFFMGLCILGAYLYLLVGLPVLLILNDKLSCCCRCSCFSACCRYLEGKTEPDLKMKGRLSRRLGNCCLRRCLVAHSVSCFAFFILIVAVFAVWVANEITVDAGVPQMFPSDHNLNSVEAVAELFGAAEEHFTNDQIRVCNFVQHQRQSQFKSCAVHLCQITLEMPLTRIGRLPDEEAVNSSETPMAECGCFPTTKPSRRCFSVSPQSTSQVWVTPRVVGDIPEAALKTWQESDEFRQFILDAALEVNSWQAYQLLRDSIPQGFSQAADVTAPHFLKQEFWETGEQLSASYNVLPSFVIPVTIPPNSSAVELCHAEEICYCGAPVCTYAGERLVDSVMPNASWDQVQIPVPETSRRLEAGEAAHVAARLPSPVSRSGRSLSSGVDVAVVWGILVEDGSPLLGSREETWSFNVAFRPESPFTQRTLLQTCRQDLPFPVPSSVFQQTFAEFVDGRVLPSGFLAKEFMWLGLDFELRVIDDVNKDAPADVGEAWHTSQLWIRAEAESAIVSSTVVTMIVSVACGLAGALLFTHLDILLSLMVVVAVTGVTISLAWFMIVFMGWPVGVLEVLGLIVFVGYSITYSLHIAHKYQLHSMELEEEPLSERRRHAVVQALQSMASSVLGSAATTLGSSFFLFFCQLVIFVKLATVLFAVTFFACVFAILALQALDLTTVLAEDVHRTELNLDFTEEPSSSAIAASSTKLTSSLARKIPKDEISSSQKTQVFISSTPSAFKSSWPVAIAPEPFAGVVSPPPNRDLFSGSISTSVF